MVVCVGSFNFGPLTDLVTQGQEVFQHFHSWTGQWTALNHGVETSQNTNHQAGYYVTMQSGHVSNCKWTDWSVESVARHNLKLHTSSLITSNQTKSKFRTWSSWFSPQVGHLTQLPHRTHQLPPTQWCGNRITTAWHSQRRAGKHPPKHCMVWPPQQGRLRVCMPRFSTCPSLKSSPEKINISCWHLKVCATTSMRHDRPNWLFKKIMSCFINKYVHDIDKMFL